MEAALEAQSDISDECKQEIQAVLNSFSQQAEAQTGGQASFEGQSDSQSKPSKAPKKHFINPGIGIAVFVVILFSGVAIYVVYVNQLLQKVFSGKKEKKLSKKKVVVPFCRNVCFTYLCA